MKNTLLIFAAITVLTLTVGCHHNEYVVVPKSTITCSCSNDTARLTILNKFMEHKINATQNITINANKVKHNDFNQTLREEFSDFFPRRTVYYVVKRMEADDIMDNFQSVNDPDPNNYYCTIEEAEEVMKILNRK